MSPWGYIAIYKYRVYRRNGSYHDVETSSCRSSFSRRIVFIKSRSVQGTRTWISHVPDCTSLRISCTQWYTTYTVSNEKVEAAEILDLIAATSIITERTSSATYVCIPIVVIAFSSYIPSRIAICRNMWTAIDRAIFTFLRSATRDFIANVDRAKYWAFIFNSLFR